MSTFDEVAAKLDVMPRTHRNRARSPPQSLSSLHGRNRRGAVANMQGL